MLLFVVPPFLEVVAPFSFGSWSPLRVWQFDHKTSRRSPSRTNVSSGAACSLRRATGTSLRIVGCVGCYWRYFPFLSCGPARVGGSQGVLSPGRSPGSIATIGSCIGHNLVVAERAQGPVWLRCCLFSLGCRPNAEAACDWQCHDKGQGGDWQGLHMLPKAGNDAACAEGVLSLDFWSYGMLPSCCIFWPGFQL